jgi:HEPN domain-containing protein
MLDKVKYWLDLSDYDMETAHGMLNIKKYLYVGFMCHQAVEKTLKALITRDCADDEIPPKIHNLFRLAELAGIYNKFSETHKGFIKILNPLNIEARYPEYKEKVLGELSAERCKLLISQTEELLCWIKQRL